jgi:hypothetical protein
MLTKSAKTNKQTIKKGPNVTKKGKGENKKQEVELMRPIPGRITRSCSEC